MVLKDQYGNDVNVEQRDDRIWYAVYAVKDAFKALVSAPIIVCNNCEAGSCINIWTNGAIIIASFKSKINSAVQPVYPYNGVRCRYCNK